MPCYRLLFPLVFLAGLSARADVTPDGTLNTQVQINDSTYQITTGTLSGTNLFHSFRDFDVNSGERALFSGAAGIARVIGRVTGDHASRIDGTLACTIPDADLYLLNPHGWLFGPGAELDLSGSFYLSSADYLRFDDGSRFETVAAPVAQLSSAPPQAFGFLQVPGAVKFDGSFLALADNADFTVAGGDIDLQWSDVRTRGGKVSLYGMRKAGEIPRQGADSEFGGAVNVANTLITASGEQSDIVIRGGRFMLDNSALQTAAAEGRGGDIRIDAAGPLAIHGDLAQMMTWSADGQAGDVVLQGGQIDIDAAVPFVGSAVAGTGHSGNVHITATRGFTLRDGSFAGTDAGIAGGKGGNIRVQADAVSLSGGAELAALAGGAGSAGSVDIRAGQVTVTEKSLLRSAAAADSGTLSVQAGRGLTLDAGSFVGTQTTHGQAGTVQIRAGSLQVAGGAALQSQAEGDGRPGMLTVQAGNAVIGQAGVGGASVYLNAGQLALQGSTVTGSGDISVTAGDLNSNGAILSAAWSADVQVQNQLKLDNSGVSANTLAVHGAHVQAGNTVFNARQGARLTAGNGLTLTRSRADAGELTVTAADLTLNDTRLTAQADMDLQITDTAVLDNSQLQADGHLAVDSGVLRLRGSSATFTGGEVDSDSLELRDSLLRSQGDLTVSGQFLQVLDGSRIGSSGVDGTVRLSADLGTITVAGRNAVGKASAVAVTGSDVVITTSALHLHDGAVISAETADIGKAGNITIQMRGGSLTMTDSARIRNQTTGSGDGGSIDIYTTHSIDIHNPDSAADFTGITTTTTGSGDSGSIQVTTPRLALSGNSGIAAETRGAGAAGGLTLATGTLNMRDGARLSTSSEGSGTGGVLRVDAGEQIHLTGADTRVASQALLSGDGGAVYLHSPDIRISAGSVQTVTYGSGKAGKVAMTTDTLNLVDGGRIDAGSTGDGNGGEIHVEVRDTALISGEDRAAEQPSGISSSAFATGAGGSLFLAADTLDLTARGTLQTLTRGDGDAGDIQVQVRDLRITDGADIDASNEGTGLGRGGDIRIDAVGTVLITAEPSTQENFDYLGGVYSYAEHTGRGGSITLDAGSLEMRGGGTLSAASDGSGNAGDIHLTLYGPLTLSEKASISGFARHAGGGNLVIDTPARIHLRDSAVTARAEGLARSDRGGNVTIRNNEFLILEDSTVLASAVGGDGGNIAITSAQFLPDGGSRVDASSELGVDGTVLVNSPDANLEESLSVPTELLSARALAADFCQVRNMSQLSRFVINRHPGLALKPEDWYGSGFPATWFANPPPALAEARQIACLSSAESDAGLRRALETLARDDAPARAAVLRSHAADVWLGIQHYDDALIALDEALVLADRSNDDTALAHVLNNAGNWYSSDEDYHNALLLYTAAQQYQPTGELWVQILLNRLRALVRIARQSQSEMPLKVDTAGERGMTRGLTRGMTRGMTRALTRGMTRGLTRGMTRALTRAMTRGMTRSMLSQRARGQSGDILSVPEPDAALPEAHCLFEIVAQAIRALPAAQRAGYWLSLAELGLAAPRPVKEVEGWLHNVGVPSRSLAREDSTKLRLGTPSSLMDSYANAYRAELYARQQRWQDALYFNRRALFPVQHRPLPTYRWQAQQGRLLDAAGDEDAALAAYRRALTNLHSVRTRLSRNVRDVRSVFRDHIRPVYTGLADLLLRRAAKLDDAARNAVLHQAATVMEQFKAAELQDYFQDACVARAQTRASPLSQSGEDFPDTAVLYPLILPQRLELLLQRDGRWLQFTVPVSEAELTRTATRFRHNLQTRTRWDFVHQGRQLYQWLIAPLREHLADIETLIIVPDGVLRMVPLTALHDGDGYLTEQFAIAMTPGLQLTDTTPLPRGNIGILLNGISEGVQDFSPLPSVPAEVERISRLYGRHKVLMNQAFVIDNLDSTLQGGPYEIVHIASHGQFDRDPGQTFLLAYDAKLTMDRLEYMLRFTQFRNEPVELLTLSACQTAVGDERAALGLAGVAIKAGARSAVASLWFVNDEATSELIVEFYRQLQNAELNKAQALRNAQRKLIAHHQFRHPAYWAPFMLIGNWR